MRNPQYWLANFMLSSGATLVSVILTKGEQILCTFGFSAEFTGILAAVMQVVGLATIPIVGLLLKWKFYPVLYAKVLSCVGFGATAVMCLVPIPRGPLGTVIAAVPYVLSGIGAISAYPLFVQLISETLFPIPDVIGFILVHVLKRIILLVFFLLENALNSELHYNWDIQVCRDEGKPGYGIEPRDYSTFKYAFFSISLIMTLIFLWFFNPVLARREAEASVNRKPSNTDTM